MSDEKDNKKKKNKKTKIIAGVVGSAALIGGAVAGGILANPKTETKIEEENNPIEPKTPTKPSNPKPSGGSPPPIPKPVSQPPGVTPRNVPSGQPVASTPTRKSDLSKKVKPLWPDVLFDANKTNQELDSIILNDIQVRWLKPKLVNPTIKYFSDSQAQTEITNQKQQPGYLYVVIIANDNDPSYQGSTNPIKIPLKQYKLSNIKQLTGLNLTADSSKKFEDFDNQIIQANEFKQHPLVLLNSTIYYYESKSDNWPTILNKMKQRQGQFWITVKATFLEPNWYGDTPKIKITLN